jgi:hypothetical protein
MVKKVLLFCVLSFLISLSANSQAEQPWLKYPQIPELSGEKIRLFTDRNIYCVNENIYFTAEYSFLDEHDTLSWSSVLYVELIRWNGNKLAQMKLKLTRPSTSGILKIPGNILSGNYYLRAYTKWMRNFSPYEYAYLPVKIINPFRSATDEGTAEKSTMTGRETPGMLRTIPINGVGCTIDKNEYKPGENAEVGLFIKDRRLTGFDRYCVSVVKTGAVDTAAQLYKPGSSPPQKNPTRLEYLPEIRGLTISGEIIDIITRLPAKEVVVSLSETQHGEQFAIYRTNDRGRFVFQLPDMQGQHDFFIQTDMPSEIHIDHGFCSQPVILPFIAFGLNKVETDLVREMVINQQISERYISEKDTVADSQHKKSEPLVFYGNKKVVYNAEKYIELPNIEEFVYEIIMEATIINDKGKTPFISMRREDFLHHLPLVLMDNVQVNNDDQLLNTPLNRIERVEVINMDYLVGGTKYGGIMSFYSINKDFAGLDLNKNGMFFTYELFSETDQVYDFLRKTPDPRIPDRRNLLYWNPDIQLSPDEKTTISFSVPDCKGDYVVYIRGKNYPDEPGIYGTCYFTVN